MLGQARNEQHFHPQRYHDALWNRRNASQRNVRDFGRLQRYTAAGHKQRRLAQKQHARRSRRKMFRAAAQHYSRLRRH